jgi:hypothetical protein
VKKSTKFKGYLVQEVSMKIINLIVLVVSLVFLSCTSSGAKVLYVDGANGNDSVTYVNNSSSTPWRTIGRAAWGSSTRSSPNTSQAAQAGDTVIVKAGTYSGTGTGIRYDPLYRPANTGISGSPIIFQAEGTVTLTQSGEGPLIGALNQNYITWKGFTIIEINALATADTGPVVLWSTTGSRIEDCVIDGYDNGRLGSNHNGIRLEYTDACVVRNNKIYNVLNFGVKHMNGSAIMTYYTTNSIIENNEIYNCGSGIFFKGRGNNTNTARYNYVYDCQWGIMYGVSEQGGNKTYQNIVRNCDYGIAHWTLVDGGFGGSTNYAVNNTIINSGSEGDIVFGNRLGSTGTFVIQNNIVSNSLNQRRVNANLWVQNYLTFNYNIYYGSTNWWRLNGAEYTSLAWRNALGGCPGAGNDCNSITNNPLFVNAGQYNYKLQAGSPALTIGLTITAIHGSSGQTIPAGVYITGNEVIGIGGTEGALSSPAGFRIVN